MIWTVFIANNKLRSCLQKSAALSTFAPTSVLGERHTVIVSGSTARLSTHVGDKGAAGYVYVEKPSVAGEL